MIYCNNWGTSNHAVCLLGSFGSFTPLQNIFPLLENSFSSLVCEKISGINENNLVCRNCVYRCTHNIWAIQANRWVCVEFYTACMGKTAPQCSLFMLHTCMDMDGASLAQASHEMYKSPHILCRCRIRWSPTRRSELQTPKVNGRGFNVEYQLYDVMYILIWWIT